MRELPTTLVLLALSACGGVLKGSDGEVPVDASPDSLNDAATETEDAADSGVGEDGAVTDGGADGSGIEGILIESLPASKNHQTATWWGYNQNKIIRSGDRVVTYVLDNNVPSGNLYSIALYQKTGNGPWTKGAVLPASAPGNLILEPSGQISLFVFEAFNMATQGAWGKLKRYMFATPGDITTNTVETIVDNDGTSETVNIRVGAAVAKDGTLYAGWGINLPGVDAQSEVLYELAPGQTTWTWSKAATQLGHDFYYPYVLPTEPGVAMLAVQDDYVPPEQGGGNIYHMTRAFERPASTWTQTPLADVRALPIAATSKQLLQVSDFFLASDGTVHGLTSMYLSGGQSGFVTETRHDVRSSAGVWSNSAFPMPDGSCNFIRLFEVDKRLMSVCQTYDKTFLRAASGTKSIQLGFPGPINGAYPFVTTPRGGTSPDELFVDMMFISGNSADFPNAPAYYARIPKRILRLL